MTDWTTDNWYVISPEDSKDDEEWGDEQNYPDEDAATEEAEDETDDIAQEENSGRNIDWKADEKSD